jgi:uncharacterized membrane protein YuzA (DUF378 family)
MRQMKAVLSLSLLGLLSVAVVVGGALLGALLAILTPFAIVFTGLCGAWFISKDFDEDKATKK